MIYRAIKYPWRITRKKLEEWKTYQVVSGRVKQNQNRPEFDFPLFKQKALAFLDGMKTDDSKIRYRYSMSCNQPTLYSSAYACMTYSLLGEIDLMSDNTRTSWLAYFDSFQSEKDGLFYDANVRNEYYDDSDWWGARHLALHMISAYTDLGGKPRYPFLFLRPYYKLDFLEEWFGKNEKMFLGSMDNDFDNKVMNISCLLQYQRDVWRDSEAGKAVSFIQQALEKRINHQTGIWGDSNLASDKIRSRKVQFAYHLLPLFFYDERTNFDFSKIIEITLKTQNRFGGFGVAVNSSACDDIDSVDILIRASKIEGKYEAQVKKSLTAGLNWIRLNQMDDGGFVFRLNEAFTYGHSQLSSEKNQGAVFPTWFRTLSLAYLCSYLEIPAEFKVTKCPGYEF